MWFDNIQKMISFLGSTPCKDDSGSTWRPEWYGSTSYEDAVQRCTAGDLELAKMMRGSEKLDINIPATGTRRKMITGVCGFMPHVPNYLANVPNNMIWCKEEKVPKKVITVVYGSNMLSYASVDEVAKTSARVLSCIMSLERKGYRINLYIANVARWDGRYGPETTGFVVKLKDSGQHLDIIKTAFPMLSSSWNRRFGFKFREMCGWPSSSSMGSSIYGKKLRDWLDKVNVKYDVAFGYHDACEIKTVEQLEELFLQNVKKNITHK